ncbi:F-box protein FBW2 [Ananas comosus]|uniref:F-box protein FBW2 n=1 Tax=Ananas comosus TaxID=4615 RepID=A0A199UN06_ANACO|nr:F-box protein FBW2 [Ananas comosus]
MEEKEEKRRCGVGGGWGEGMSPEILALIFVRMAADEMVRTVPFVCRAWREAVVGPYCWGEIDVEAWCRRVNRSDLIDAAVRRLVRRSRGFLRRLSAYRLGNSGFSFVAAFTAGFLRVLQIPLSEVTDQTVEKHVKSLSGLTVLDISNCMNITPKGIAMIGRHCKSLVQLKRNMPPWEPSQSKIDEDEALAVADTMPKLEHLELAYGRFSDHGLEAILTKCTALCNLDILGCLNVTLKYDIEAKCLSLPFFRDPWEDDDLEYSSSSGDDAYYDDSSS